jgi:hypothetical protein
VRRAAAFVFDCSLMLSIAERRLPMVCPMSASTPTCTKRRVSQFHFNFQMLRCVAAESGGRSH